MSIERKTILIAGLGRYGPSASASANKEKVQADIAKAREHGFECSDIECNPEDLSGTLEALKEKLRSQHWDGFNIGYGVRGLKQYTELFEGAINAAREITPGTKFMFSTSPDGVFEAIQRAFPEVEKK